MRWLAILAVTLVVAGGARPARAVRTADVPMVASDATSRGAGERHHVLRATSAPDKRFAKAAAPAGGPLADRRDERGVDSPFLLAVRTPLALPHVLPFATAPPVAVRIHPLTSIPPSSRGPPFVLAAVTHLS